MSRYTLPFLGTTRPNPGTNEPYDTTKENASFDQIDTKLSDVTQRSTNLETARAAIEAKAAKSYIPKVASAAARLTEFPNPVAGDRCFRTDLMRDEVYYTAYHPTTNPQGGPTTGWHPPGGDTGWQKVASSVGAPAFAAGWGHYTDAAIPWTGLHFRKTNGFVTVSGAVTHASWGALAPIFVLPSHMWPTVTIDGASVRVKANGTVQTNSAGTTAMSLFLHFPV